MNRPDDNTHHTPQGDSFSDSEAVDTGEAAAAGEVDDTDEAVDVGGGIGGIGGVGAGDAGDDEPEHRAVLFPANFWEHIEALRWVIVKSVIVFGVAMLLMMCFSVYAQKLLTWPLQYGMALAGVENQVIELRTDGPFSVFTFMLQLWVFGGLLLSLPFIIYFAAGFIAPGLTAHEKKMLRPVAFASLGLFLVGCLFAFFLLLPTYMAVSLSLERAFGFASLWTPGSYYGAVVWTTFGLGIVFEFPLVLVLLQYMGLIRAATLRHYRKHAFVFILIFAALLTPGGDPITLAVAAVPLYLLFEMSILMGERLYRTPKADAYDDEA